MIRSLADIRRNCRNRQTAGSPSAEANAASGALRRHPATTRAEDGRREDRMDAIVIDHAGEAISELESSKLS